MAKRVENTTQFCVIPRKSIKLLAESVGIHYLSSEGAGLLAEDISYRIRQTVQSAIEFSKHSKRDHLTGDDINRALHWSCVEPIYGYGSKNSNIFSSISTKDGDIFYHEDKEVNLRELTFSKGLSSLNELGDSHSRINVEISLLDKTKATLTEGPSDGAGILDFNALSDAYKSYYNQLTQNTLEAEESVVKTVLADLRINPRVQIFLPYLVNFISNGIKLLTGNFEKVLRLFALVKALVDNKNLYLEPWVVQFVRAVMHCVIEKPAVSTGSAFFDGWILRNRAIQILCHIDRKCSNSANYLHHQLLRTFKDIFEDKERPLYSQYGAIVGIYMLGVDAVEQTVLPHFKTYVEHLETLRNKDLPENKELDYIMHGLKCCILSVLRSKLRFLANIAAKESEPEHVKGQNSSNSNHYETSHRTNYLGHSKWNKDIVTWYKDGYDLFGQAFILQAGSLEDCQHIIHSTPSNPAKTSFVHKLHSQTSNISYIRTLIKDALALLTVKTNVELAEDSFSLPIKKRRVCEQISTKNGDETIGSACKLKFLSCHDSEVRFNGLVKKSALSGTKNINCIIYAGKKCRRSKQSTKRKLSFSLSFL